MLFHNIFAIEVQKKVFYITSDETWDIGKSDPLLCYLS